MKRRMLSGLMALVLTLCLLPRAAAAYSPYYIKVNRVTCTVTVYETDGAGKPASPIEAMICSVGKEGKGLSPLGVHTLTGYKPMWCKMVGGAYAQYVSQIKGNILFHSLTYSEKDKSTMRDPDNYYNKLGEPMSLGCIRLQAIDAKWIYDNAPAGTKVEIFDGTEADDPLGKPERLVDYIDPEDPNANWDPTDPEPSNPWHGRLKAEEEAKEAQMRAEEERIRAEEEAKEAQIRAEKERLKAEEKRRKTAFSRDLEVTVGSARVTFPAYAKQDAAGNETNFVALRDMARVLAAGYKSFAVDWQDGIVLRRGQYSATGGEFTRPVAGDAMAEETQVTLRQDGVERQVAALVLTDESGGGHTYLKLRDLAELLGLNVSWSAEEGVVLTDRVSG